MRRYSFRLQALLRVRELREEESERLFQGALRDLTVAVETLDEYRARIEQAIGDVEALRERGINLSLQILYDEYFERMRERVRRQIDVINTAEELVEQRREELIEKIKDRKTVERLRLRDYDRYLQELRRFEQSVIDDLSTLRGGRRSMEKLGVTPI